MDRVIMHIDMNAFFASVEQTANPFIAGKPVGIGNPKYENTALVAVSYEARARGVKNLSRAKEARAICPDLLVIPFDPLKYYSVNRQIIKILREYTPQVEVYSIDEAFLDLTDVLHLYRKTPVDLAQEIKDRIRAEVGFKLTSSVGIAPNKLLAKIGSDFKKPDGMTVITWEDRFKYLDNLYIQDVWGIGYRGTAKLSKAGITSTKHIRELSDSELRGIVGSYWTRLKQIANGENYDKVDPTRTSKPHKTMQHAHTMSNATSDPEYLKTIIRKMSERLARRLRKFEQNAAVVYLGFKPERQAEGYGWGSPTRFNDLQTLPVPSNHGKDIYEAALKIFSEFELDNTRIRLVVVGVGGLKSVSQLLLNIFQTESPTKVDKAIDEINQTYGEFTVRSADILHQRVKESELHVEREDMTFHPASGH